MVLRVSHLSRYEYAREVSFSPHALYLRPRESSRHRLRRFSLTTSPASRIAPGIDPHDNAMLWAHFSERAAALEFRTEFEIERDDPNPFDFLLHPSAAAFPFDYEPGERFALAPYLAPPFEETRNYLLRWLRERLPTPPGETVPYLTALNSLIFGAISYQRREEGRSQPSAETLALGSGSCRDFAVLAIELCRTLGVAARFVSGYLHESPEAGSPPLPGAMHAWAEVFLPGAGWKGIDPTRGIFCDEAFVPVAHAAQADFVTPIQGRYYSPSSVPSTLKTSVSVEKLA